MSQQQAHLDRQLPAQSPSTVPGLLQRACACGKHKTDQHGECAECRKKRLGLQRRAVAGAAPVSGPETAPPIGSSADQIARGSPSSDPSSRRRSA